LALATVVSYATVVFVVGQASGLFGLFSRFQRFATSVAFAPMALSWVYGGMLRLSPGHSPTFYFWVVMTIALPFTLALAVSVFRLATRPDASAIRLRRISTLELLVPVLLLVVLGVTLSIIANTVAVVPISTNDPMEYFAVARAIFEKQQLTDVYPVLDDSVLAGFYGPWTHPAGYVLIIAWLYLCQGTAEVAGIAKLLNVYGAAALVMVTWAWSGGPYRLSSAIAALLVLLVPLLMAQAFDMHVDILRLAMFTSVICMVPKWLSSRNVPSSLAFGFVVGLSIFIHSLGVLFVGFFAGLLLFLQSDRLVSRLALGLLVITVSLVMLAPDFLINYWSYGYLIGDSAPLWRVPSLNLVQFLNDQRGIGSLGDKIVYGVFAPISRPSILGWTTIAFATVLPLYVAHLAFVRVERRVFLRRILRATLANTLVMAMGGFALLLAFSVGLGSNAIIKNVRYVGTMSVIAGIAAVLIGAQVGFWLSYRSRTRLVALRFCFALLAVALSWSLVSRVIKNSDDRIAAFPTVRDHASDIDLALACGLNPGLRLVSSINEALALSPVRRVKIFDFAPAASAYYGRYPIVSYLDPKVLPAFLAPNSDTAFKTLKALGITHVLTPANNMGEIVNTAMGPLFEDTRYFRPERVIGNNRLLVAAGEDPLLPINVTKAGSIRIFPADGGALVIDGTDLRCTDNSSISGSGESAILTLVGRGIVSTGQRFEVDTTKRYRLSFDLRVPIGSPAANTWAGLATFDVNGLLQTEEPGTYRYGAIQNLDLVPSAEWSHYSGEFGGVGNQSHSQFRPGTHTVSPTFLLNYYSPQTSTSQIRNIVFEEID